jgi:hypothetical protein
VPVLVYAYFSPSTGGEVGGRGRALGTRTEAARKQEQIKTSIADMLRPKNDTESMMRGRICHSSHAKVCVCVRACVRACVRVRVSESDCVYVCGSLRVGVAAAVASGDGVVGNSVTVDVNAVSLCTTTTITTTTTAAAQ